MRDDRAVETRAGILSIFQCKVPYHVQSKSTCRGVLLLGRCCLRDRDLEKKTNFPKNSSSALGTSRITTSRVTAAEHLLNIFVSLGRDHQHLQNVSSKYSRVCDYRTQSSNTIHTRSSLHTSRESSRNRSRSHSRYLYPTTERSSSL